MFKPQAIYYEKEIENYQLGKELLEKYKEVPKILIENHNNIEEMRKKNNSEFPKIKHNLIIGTTRSGKGETFVVPHQDVLRCVYIAIWYVITINVHI